MRRSVLMAVGLVLVATTLTLFGQDAKTERGKYLVEESVDARNATRRGPRRASSTARIG